MTRSALLAGLLLSCQGPSGARAQPEDTAVGEAAPAPPGVLDEVSAPGFETDDGIEVSLSEAIATVIIVRWTTETPSAGRVEFGTDTTYGHTTPWTEEGTEHEALLLGMQSDTLVHLRVDYGGELGQSEDLEMRTGPLPSGMPILSFEGGPIDGYLVSSLLGQACGPMVLDAQGHVVWYLLEADGAEGCGRAWLSTDRRSVLYGVMVDGTESIRRVSLDGTHLEDLDVPGFSHDFVEHADGTVAFLAHDIRTIGAGADATELWGDRLLERRPDGELVEIWNAWDVYDPEDTAIEVTGGTSWTHGNALDYDPSTEHYTVGLRNPSALLHIERGSGEATWVLGGPTSTFTLGDDTTATDYQHQFTVLDDGVLVFDNRSSDVDTARVVEYAFDGDTAHEVWTYETVPPLVIVALGDALRLDNGDTIVSWSTAGQLEQVDAEGELIWRINTDLGTAFGYLSHTDSLYAE